jgi:hypothetical protein
MNNKTKKILQQKNKKTMNIHICPDRRKEIVHPMKKGYS